MNPQARLTFFLGDEQKQVFTKYSYYIPRINDEIRIDSIIYKVILLVWCYDEKLYPNKINIKIEEVNDE